MKYAWLSTSRCQEGEERWSEKCRVSPLKAIRECEGREWHEGWWGKSNLRVTAIIRPPSPSTLRGIPKALAGIIKVSRCRRYNLPTSRSPKRAFEEGSMTLRLGFAKIDMSLAIRKSRTFIWTRPIPRSRLMSWISEEKWIPHFFNISIIIFFIYIFS